MLNVVASILVWTFGASVVLFMYYMFRAAQRRQAGISFFIAFGIPSILFRPGLYREEAFAVRRRSIQCLGVAVLSCVLLLVVVQFLPPRTQ